MGCPRLHAWVVGLDCPFNLRDEVGECRSKGFGAYCFHLVGKL